MDNLPSLRIVDQDMNPPEEIAIDGAAAFSRMPLNLEVSVEKIRSRRDAGEAFRLACIASALDDKEIYMPLGIDPGYFTNIKNGKATLKASLEPKFCQIVGNHIYPEWRAYQLGCTLAPIDGTKDRVSALEDKIDQLLLLLKSKGSI